MNLQFTHPWWLLVIPVGLVWTILWARKSHIQIAPWRRWSSAILRCVVVILVGLALAGIQKRISKDGMNVFFLLDRSRSVPSPQQELARNFVNASSKEKKQIDRGGIIVFGSEAAIENIPNFNVDLKKVQAVIGEDRTDIASAIRLGTAAFPESGQKRLVVISDGNENMGSALDAVAAARPLGVTVDVLPVGAVRAQDVAVQKLGLPSTLKKGQTFEAKIFVESDREQTGVLRLFQNEQFLGAQPVELNEGKNLFTFPQQLTEPGFYSYSVEVEVEGDILPQNNRASSFVNVSGDPRVLVISDLPEMEQQLVAALQEAKLDIKLGDSSAFPEDLSELQSFDSIFLCNIAAGDLGRERMRLLESAVRDFGVGLVCVGGDQSFAAGAYRGTPLEDTLPVNMNLDSKKVLPKGALALLMHGMEFNNGNQVARDIALGTLDALGPRDEMGVLLWDGNERWLFPLTEVGDKKELARMIAGMNQGDLPNFHNLMKMGYEGLEKSNANLKHMIVFSDGDPGAPSDELMGQMRDAKITVSTVLISGHAGPQTMIDIANKGNGRFYNIVNPADLPQVFIKETAVILKSAIFEEPFQPELVSSTEPVRGIGAMPAMQGYVATSPKPRAELPLVTDKGDPLLAHWQYGLGRSVAFTSDARAKWARSWLDWSQYRQFWSQVAKWSLRRLEGTDFSAQVSLENGRGVLSVEALDSEGNFRNFLDLRTVVVDPKGERQTLFLEQTGPGRYEVNFDTKEVGAYMMNLLQHEGGQPVGGQVLGAAVNYSPEFNDSRPNLSRLKKLAEMGGGRVLDPTNAEDNPYLHDRLMTHHPVDLWEWMLKLAICLFPIDVGLRRIQLDQEEWQRMTRTFRRILFFWRKEKVITEREESMAALLARKEKTREAMKQEAPPVQDLFRPREEAPADKPLPGTRKTTTLKSESRPEVKSEESRPAEESTSASRLLAAKNRVKYRKRK